MPNVVRIFQAVTCNFIDFQQVADRRGRRHVAEVKIFEMFRLPALRVTYIWLHLCRPKARMQSHLTQRLGLDGSQFERRRMASIGWSFGPRLHAPPLLVRAFRSRRQGPWREHMEVLVSCRRRHLCPEQCMLPLVCEGQADGWHSTGEFTRRRSI